MREPRLAEPTRTGRRLPLLQQEPSIQPERSLVSTTLRAKAGTGPIVAVEPPDRALGPTRRIQCVLARKPSSTANRPSQSYASQRPLAHETRLSNTTRRLLGPRGHDDGAEDFQHDRGRGPRVGGFDLSVGVLHGGRCMPQLKPALAIQGEMCSAVWCCRPGTCGPPCQWPQQSRHIEANLQRRCSP